MADKTIFFNHKVGDGLHYVTRHRDTSETCTLYNLFILIIRHRLGSLPELWNQVYPDDIMSEHDLAYIIASALPVTDPFDPNSPENIRDILNDLRCIGCADLAALVDERLRIAGVNF